MRGVKKTKQYHVRKSFILFFKKKEKKECFFKKCLTKVLNRVKNILLFKKLMNLYNIQFSLIKTLKKTKHFFIGFS